eukprot:TRINITY_DN2693_c0_g1_i8.p1 TRINITY_DN2693_c0_g1~~TRINITY_DN2693_c0_g1_i8.p1  ORF type:complete len:498 (-),score=75.22 TRINITY_DN2693_c0_g1_i8:28-1521(-)
MILVIDRSGSMQSLMEIVRETCCFIIEKLASQDNLAIVDYDSYVTDLFPLAPMDEWGKKRATDAVMKLTARGGTDLAGGLFRGLKHVLQRKAPHKNEICSVLLFTDGEANEGIRDKASIIKYMKDTKFILAQNPKSKSGAGPTPRASMIYRPTITQSAQKPKTRSNSLQTKAYLTPQKSPKKQAPVSRASQAPPASLEELFALETGKDTSPADEELNCSVNTFGFGSSHNADLLKAISHAGNGLYFYIQNSDGIGEAFVDCMGGLLSVVGQGLKLSIQSEGKTELLDVLTSYPKTKLSKGLSITIKDIQAEESRDLICRVRVPKEEKDGIDTHLLTSTLSYFHVVAACQDTLSVKSMLHRPLKLEEKDAKKDSNVDKQRNRVEVADALKQADELAKRGKLDDARTLLVRAIDKLNLSITAKDPFVISLAEGLQTALGGLKSSTEYSSWGGKKMTSMSDAHHQQRSSAAAPVYQNSNRKIGRAVQQECRDRSRMPSSA